MFPHNKLYVKVTTNVKAGECCDREQEVNIPKIIVRLNYDTILANNVA